MMYILVGNDSKKITASIEKESKGTERIELPSIDIVRERILEYAQTQHMFGEKMSLVLENALAKLSFSKDDLHILKNSLHMFFFREDKLLAAEQKKYASFAAIEKYEEKVTTRPLLNTFSIVDAYGRKDKVKAWILYREAIEHGIAPEAISGLLFWKIKTMLLTRTPLFGKDELKRSSSKLVSLYHKAHRGELDITLGLEQFILSTLSK
jgi:DNA polymerase III delta subunit